MPELPEVETTCHGIAPHIKGKVITDVIVRQKKLRWPIADDIKQRLIGLPITRVSRRAKYILLETNKAESVILHLGMSGHLRICTSEQAVEKHDHVDFIFSDETILRYNDTRRFGSIVCTSEPIGQHKLLKNLGPEPLSDQLTGEWLYQLSKNKKMAVKAFIMEGKHVVGVGNIYASESLFLAQIHPAREAGKVSLVQYEKLVTHIKNVLKKAIEQGGTTLRDFVNEQGNPGYFQQSLSVYGRNGQPCVQCSTEIESIKIAQRASCFCPTCQK